MAPTQNIRISYYTSVEGRMVNVDHLMIINIGDSSSIDGTIPKSNIPSTVWPMIFDEKPKKKPPVKGSSGFTKFIKQKHENR